MYNWDENLHLGGLWSCKRCFMKMHAGAKLHLGAICFKFQVVQIQWRKYALRCIFALGCK